MGGPTKSTHSSGLPPYFGPYQVGVHDIETPAENDNVGVLVRLYYPIADEHAKWHSKGYWLPKTAFYASGYADFMGVGWFATPFFAAVLGTVRKPAYVNAPLLSAQQPDAAAVGEPQMVPPNVVDMEDAPATPRPKAPQKFPLAIYSHGLGGTRTTYSTFCGDLASFGFVVACIEHRDGSAAVSAKSHYKERVRFRRPDPKEVKHGQTNDEYLFELRRGQVTYKVREINETVALLRKLEEGVKVDNLFPAGKFEEGSFKGRLDFSHFVMSGHSFGGAAALTALQQPDHPFKCGIIMDPWMYAVLDEPIHVPIISLQSETFHWKKNLDPLKKLLTSTPPTSKFMVIRGTSHQDVSDLPLMYPWLAKKIGLSGTADTYYAFDVSRKAHFEFLRRMLVVGAEKEDETDGKEGKKGKGMLDPAVFLPAFVGYAGTDDEEDVKNRPHALVVGEEAYELLKDIRVDWG
ncbi:Platelet-activating factor acetylhydrolase, partial [Quaeritorhiza haematococci]